MSIALALTTAEIEATVAAFMTDWNAVAASPFADVGEVCLMDAAPSRDWHHRSDDRGESRDAERAAIVEAAVRTALANPREDIEHRGADVIRGLYLSDPVESAATLAAFEPLDLWRRSVGNGEDFGAVIGNLAGSTAQMVGVSGAALARAFEQFAYMRTLLATLARFDVIDRMGFVTYVARVHIGGLSTATLREVGA